MEAIIPKGPEILVALVSFFILLFVLGKFAFPPVVKMLDERAEKIRESLDKAEETKVEAERLLGEYQQQLAVARVEANKVIEQGRVVAESVKNEIIAKAKEEAEAEKEKAIEAIKAEKVAAMADLQRQVADISVAVAAKIIGSSLKIEDHAALIERYVAEVGSLNEN